MSLVLTIVFYRSQLTLHFDPGGSAIRLGLLAPIMSALFVNVSLNDPLGEIEGTFVKRMRMLRAFHMVGVLGLMAVSLAAFLLVYGGGDQLAHLARNSGLLTGALLCTATFISSSHAWVLPMGAVLATYGFGMNYSLGVAHPWALLLRDVSLGNVISGVAFAAVGAACFIWRGPRTIYNDEVES